MSEAASDRLGPHMHHHAVQFYGTDESLFTTVSAFLAEGIVSGHPAIVIATPGHRAQIEKHLCGRMIDCERAQGNGDLQLLDAEETLALFMRGDTPDSDSFNDSVGRLVGQLLKDRRAPILRAYGEMVDVLWKQGRPEAAIKLEILWNKLALRHNFALLCGYAMGSFYKQTQQLEAVVAQHTEVVAPGSNVVPFANRRIVRSA